MGSIFLPISFEIELHSLPMKIDRVKSTGVNNEPNKSVFNKRPTAMVKMAVGPLLKRPLSIECLINNFSCGGILTWVRYLLKNYFLDKFSRAMDGICALSGIFIEKTVTLSPSSKMGTQSDALLG